MIKHKSGYSLLVAVLIIGSALSIAVLTSLLRGTNANLITTTNNFKHQNLILADTCSELSLMYLRNNDTFTGSNSQNFLTGTCDYTIINTGGETRTIQITSTQNNLIRREIIKITEINPQIIIQERYPTANF